MVGVRERGSRARRLSGRAWANNARGQSCSPPPSRSHHEPEPCPSQPLSLLPISPHAVLGLARSSFLLCPPCSSLSARSGRRPRALAVCPASASFTCRPPAPRETHVLPHPGHGKERRGSSPRAADPEAPTAPSLTSSLFRTPHTKRECSRSAVLQSSSPARAHAARPLGIFVSDLISHAVPMSPQSSLAPHTPSTSSRSTPARQTW